MRVPRAQYKAEAAAATQGATTRPPHPVVRAPPVRIGCAGDMLTVTCTKALHSTAWKHARRSWICKHVQVLYSVRFARCFQKKRSESFRTAGKVRDIGGKRAVQTDAICGWHSSWWVSVF